MKAENATRSIRNRVEHRSQERHFRMTIVVYINISRIIIITVDRDAAASLRDLQLATKSKFRFSLQFSRNKMRSRTRKHHPIWRSVAICVALHLSKSQHRFSDQRSFWATSTVLFPRDVLFHQFVSKYRDLDPARTTLTHSITQREEGRGALHQCGDGTHRLNKWRQTALDNL